MERTNVKDITDKKRVKQLIQEKDKEFIESLQEQLDQVSGKALKKAEDLILTEQKKGSMEIKNDKNIT